MFIFVKSVVSLGMYPQESNPKKGNKTKALCLEVWNAALFIREEQKKATKIFNLGHGLKILYRIV